MDKLKKSLIRGILIALALCIMPNVYASEVETGTIGEYDTLEEAEVVAEENKKDDEKETIETEIVEETREYVEDYVSFDEVFNTELGARVSAEIFRAAYGLMGYDVSDAEIVTKVVTETEVETRVFHSLTEILTYRAAQQALGYDVDIRLVDLDVSTREVNQESVDETFDSILDLVRYLVSLARDHNKFDLHYENASYVITTDADVSKTFTSRLEALAYLVQLGIQYDDVTDVNIEFHPDGTTESEPISELFMSEGDANDYIEDLEDEGYQVENVTITELTSEEIDMDAVLESEHISLSTDDVTFNSLTALGNSSVVIDFLDNQGQTITANGTLSISEIIIDGETYRPILNSLIVTIPNNTPITIRGTITSDYCTRYITIMGRRICTQYKTFEFVSNGIVNDELNGETTVITRETFIYVPEYVDYTGERTILLDNLIHIYELDAEKVTVFEGPCYTVTAHVHDEDLVPQIRVYGEVSKIELVPEYTIEFTKTREVTKYNALADATLMGEKEVYVVNYTKTTKDPVEPTPVDPVTPVNPKTGDSVDVYMGILAVSLLSLGTTVYRKKHN